MAAAIPLLAPLRMISVLTVLCSMKQNGYFKNSALFYEYLHYHL